MRVHCNGADALCRELVVLVLHQRDQGAHDDRKSGKLDGGKLVDQRFPAAGGHYDKRVFPRENCVYRLPLAPTEITMAKALREQLTGCFLRYSFRHSVGYRHKLFRHAAFPEYPPCIGTYVRSATDVT